MENRRQVLSGSITQIDRPPTSCEYNTCCRVCLVATSDYFFEAWEFQCQLNFCATFLSLKGKKDAQAIYMHIKHGRITRRGTCVTVWKKKKVFSQHSKFGWWDACLVALNAVFPWVRDEICYCNMIAAGGLFSSTCPQPNGHRTALAI